MLGCELYLIDKDLEEVVDMLNKMYNDIISIKNKPLWIKLEHTKFDLRKCLPLEVNNPIAKVINHTITWMDDLGNVLETDVVEDGIVPTYYSGVPYKAEDDSNTYEFAGWTPEVGPAFGDTVYTAMFNAIPKVVNHTVTWMDDLGNILETDVVPDGTVPTYDGETPYKPEDESNTYEFMGWNPVVEAVYADTVYTAVFSAVSKTVYRQVTWMAEAGNILETDTV
jgi:hypothetical protein